jgi:hypothetical protein
MSTKQPEPCLSGHGERCYAPVACEAFGYCRERNTFGLPDKETAKKWQMAAAERKDTMK